MTLLKDKVAFITGATRGIGYSVAEKFLENGAKVIVCGSREESAAKAAARLKEKFPDSYIEGLAPDLSNPASIQEAITYVKETLGRLDILVNNAGISASHTLYDYKPEEFEKIMNLNVNAVFFCSQAAAKVMRDQGGGVILSTSSMVSIYGQALGAGYPTSKFAVNGLTKSLARELGKDNIRVNAVAPGIINTDMMRAVPKDVIQPLINQIPLKRIGEPEDIANAFLFLASDLASYITGVILSVDGSAMS
ncbi:MAG: 3-oxoacyl-ACP reductase family protein [Eubacteriales bacterium]|nr:3-oxoacyl-ACP reductase family protein [Eubacteriales bacterium]